MTECYEIVYKNGDTKFVFQKKDALKEFEEPRVHSIKKLDFSHDFIIQILAIQLNKARQCLMEVNRISCVDGYDCFINITDETLEFIRR